MKTLTEDRAAEIAASVGCTPEQVRGVWEFAKGKDVEPPEEPWRQLLWMREKGSSISLTGGDLGEAWECSWITGGKRCTGVSAYPEMAIERALQEAGLL